MSKNKEMEERISKSFEKMDALISKTASDLEENIRKHLVNITKREIASRKKENVMKKVVSELTMQQVATQVVEKLREFYSGQSMDMTIGLNHDGSVEYWYDVHGFEGMALEIVSTAKGDSIFADDNPYDQAFWDENFRFMIRLFYENFIPLAVREARTQEDPTEFVFSD